jgi:23S rRNA (uracil1939-C5)-methyltransferase
MQLKIEKLVYGGDGLARLPADERGPGKTAFVPFVLEGEQVEVAVTEQKPGFARGQLEQVIESSGNRIEPACPYFQRCGGCHYQHANYRHQLELKAGILRETLKRIAKVELPCELQVHPSPEWGYRNRTRLKVQSEPEFALGYYKFRSHELLPVEQCPISSPLINRAIAALWASGRSGEIPEGVCEIEFFADHADAALLIEAYCDLGTSRSDAQQLAEKLTNMLPDVTGTVAFERSPANQFLEPKPMAVSGETELSYQTERSSYRVSAGAFFQVNRFLVDQLVDITTSSASGRLALDLYAGVGLFSTILARSFAQVIAVEASQTSHSDLRHNAGREVKAVLATTEQYLEQASGIRPDLVVADPPRGGLGENVVRSLAKLDAPRITYVSCDPSTLARDLRILLSLGYKIDGAHLIDLFPQTYHLESVFHLAR